MTNWGMLLLRGYNMEFKISPNLKKLAKYFPDGLYIVGGYVRNSLLGIPLDDIDICSSMTLDTMKSKLAGSEFELKIKNKQLGTAIITCEDESYEYSTFRKESYASTGAHTPETVEFIQDPAQDAARRDFTVNALYYDIGKDELLDFYHGIEDARKKILRTVEDPESVLAKDGARILRLFRFQCELGFKIEKQTLQTAIKYASNVQDLSSERKVYEITKILHSGTRYPKYSKPNAFMKAFKMFNKISLWSMFGIEVPRIKFNMVKKVEHKSQGFLVDLIDTINPISISYYLQHLLENMGINKKLMSQLINILSGYYDALNKLDNKTYFFKYFDNFPTIFLLLCKQSKYLAMKYEFFYKYIISHKLVISVKDLKITGDDIKKHYPDVNPKRFKPILESLLSDVFDCKINNDTKSLIRAVEQKLKYL